MKENLTTAKKSIDDAINEIYRLNHENRQLKGLLYRSILKNGSQLSDKPLTDEDLENINFSVSKDEFGKFVVIVEKQKNFKK